MEAGVPFSVCGFFTLSRQTLLTVSGNEWALRDLHQPDAKPHGDCYVLCVNIILTAIYVRIFVCVLCICLYVLLRQLCMCNGASPEGVFVKNEKTSLRLLVIPEQPSVSYRCGAS